MTRKLVRLRCIRPALVTPGRIAQAAQVIEVPVALAHDLLLGLRFELVDAADRAAIADEARRRNERLPRVTEPYAPSRSPWIRT